MDPLFLILLLVGGAAVLLVADLFLPTGGIMSLVGVGLLLTAVIICFTLNQWLGLGVLFAGVVASPFVAYGMIQAWTKTPVAKRMMLRPDSVLATPRQPGVRVGSVGRTLTVLRPMGEAEFDTEDGPLVVQATCETGDLPPDAAVRVIHFKDGLATVRADAGETA